MTTIRGFDAAQAAYDRAEPPDDHGDEKCLCNHTLDDHGAEDTNCEICECDGFGIYSREDFEADKADRQYAERRDDKEWDR